MRAVAVIVNLVQMIIVLLVFIVQGFVLGGWTVFALFILLLIAFLNLLVLLFHPSMAGSDRMKLVKDHASIIKRQDQRVIYPAARRPVLMIGNRKFDILDLSEQGLRFSIGRNEQLRKRMRCRLTLLSGQTLNFKAVLIRREGGHAVLQFKQPIAYRKLIDEKQAAVS